MSYTDLSKAIQDEEVKDFSLDAINLVLAERQRQDDKWGEQNNHVAIWTTIIGEEYGELCEAVNETVFDNGTNKGGLENILKEASHVAATAVALIEGLLSEKEKQNGRIKAYLG